MSERLELRSAAESDNDQFREWVQSCEDYSAFPLPLQKQLAETQWLGWCRGLREQDGATTQVLCEGAEAVGVVVLQRDEILRVLDVIVAPEQRNRGIGSWLLEALQREHQVVELRVRKESPARRLYERHGFVVHGEDAIHVHMRWLALP